MTQNTVEVILRGKDHLSPVFTAAGMGVSTFTSATLGQMSRLKNSIFSISNLLAVRFGKDVATSFIKASAAVEDYQVQFGVLLKSADAGAKYFDKIQKMSAKTPYLTQDLADSATQLLNVFSKSTVTDRLAMLGDIASGDAQKLQTLTRAYGRMGQKGKASLEEINMITETNVNIMAALKTATGAVSMSALYKDISAGKVLFGDVQSAMQSMTAKGGQYYEMMIKKSATLNGKLSTLQDNIIIGQSKLGEGMSKQLKSIIDDLLSEIDRLSSDGTLEAWGAKAGALMHTLYEALKSLAKFINDNGDLLKNLGFSYAAIKILTSLSSAIDATTIALKAQSAAAVANGLAASTALPHIVRLANALKSLAAIGVSFAVGWGVGRLIGEFTGLDKVVTKFFDHLYGNDKPQKTMRQALADAYKVHNPNATTAEIDANWQQYQTRKKALADAKKAKIEKEKQDEINAEKEKAKALADAKKAAEDAKTKAEADAAAAKQRAIKKAIDAEIRYRKTQQDRLAKAAEALSDFEAEQMEIQNKKIHDQIIIAITHHQSLLADQAKRLTTSAQADANAYQAAKKDIINNTTSATRAAAKKALDQEKKYQQDLARARSQATKKIPLTQKQKDILNAEAINSQAQAKQAHADAINRQINSIKIDLSRRQLAETARLANISEQQLQAQRTALQLAADGTIQRKNYQNTSLADLQSLTTLPKNTLNNPQNPYLTNAQATINTHTKTTLPTTQKLLTIIAQATTTTAKKVDHMAGLTSGGY
jgi:tape measure domain-containing protein